MWAVCTGERSDSCQPGHKRRLYFYLRRFVYIGCEGSTFVVNNTSVERNLFVRIAQQAFHLFISLYRLEVLPHI